MDRLNVYNDASNQSDGDTSSNIFANETTVSTSVSHKSEDSAGHITGMPSITDSDRSICSKTSDEDYKMDELLSEGSSGSITVTPSVAASDRSICSKTGLHFLCFSLDVA